MGLYGSPELTPNNNYSDKNLHSFVKCKKCGFSYSTYYSRCPQCNRSRSKKISVLGIIALIFSFIFFPIGLILSLIDMLKNKNNNHILSIIALVVSILFLSIFAMKKYKLNSFNNQLSVSSNNQITSSDNKINTERKIIYNSANDAYGINTIFSSVYISQGTKKNLPRDGYVFYICEFDIGNNTKYNLSINSKQNFSAYADDYLCNNTYLIFDSENEHNYFDCTISQGKRNKGVVVFEVPKNYQKIEIRYKPFTDFQGEFIFTIKANK